MLFCFSLWGVLMGNRTKEKMDDLSFELGRVLTRHILDVMIYESLKKSNVDVDKNGVPEGATHFYIQSVHQGKAYVDKYKYLKLEEGLFKYYEPTEFNWVLVSRNPHVLNEINEAQEIYKRKKDA